MRAAYPVACAILVGCGLNAGGTGAGPGADAAGSGPDTGVDSTASLDAGDDSASSLDDATVPDASVGPMDASNEEAGPVPDTGLSGVACPSAPCGAGTMCCTVPNVQGLKMSCEASCPSDMVACRTPVDCDGGYCCSSLTFNQAIPFCAATSASANCSASACADNFPVPPCGMTTSVRLCGKTSDCATDALGPNCCTFAFAPGFYACVNDMLSMNATSCL